MSCHQREWLGSRVPAHIQLVELLPADLSSQHGRNWRGSASDHRDGPRVTLVETQVIGGEHAWPEPMGGKIVQVKAQ